jgi:hypothetical protein
VVPDRPPPAALRARRSHRGFLDRPLDVIYPFQLDETQVTLGRYLFQSLARLKPDATLATATADLGRIVPLAIEWFPAPAGYTRDRFAKRPVVPHLRLVKDEVVGDVGRTLWIVMGTLGVVLVIACANVAHLLLVRADRRRRELAVRFALGAAPGRIASSLLVQGVLLGIVGGLREIEQAVSRANANLPVAQVRRLSNVYRASMARTSFTLSIH